MLVHRMVRLCMGAYLADRQLPSSGPLYDNLPGLSFLAPDELEEHMEAGPDPEALPYEVSMPAPSITQRKYVHASHRSDRCTACGSLACAYHDAGGSRPFTPSAVAAPPAVMSIPPAPQQ